MNERKIGADFRKWYLFKCARCWWLCAPEWRESDGGVFETFDEALDGLRERLAA